MKFYIRERIFTVRNTFDIKDEDKLNRFKVKGRALSLGKKLKLYDREEDREYAIEQRLLKLMEEYSVYVDNKRIAKVSRRVSLLRPRYTIESVYGDIEIEGDVLKHDFDIVRQGQTIARVRKKFIALSDEYVVDIDQEEDYGFILALVIILDQIHHDFKPVSKDNIKDMR